MNEPLAKGPLQGLRVIEFAGIGPGPHCAMLLADLGAEVVRFEKAGGNGWPNPVIDRGRHVMTVDIRSEEGRELCIAAAASADVLIEGYRPGVMERHGLGPDILMKRNARLIYGRMTGWGQDGPLARVAGHDINYVALTGALAAMGAPGEPPRPPLNLVGDFGGGSLFLAFGIMAALWERQRSGLGQVVDAAILDGVASMMSMFTGMSSQSSDPLDRHTSLLGGAAPFYRCYECADGQFVSVGAVEPKFYEELLDRIGAPADFYVAQNDSARWKERSAALEILFKSKTREEWCALLEGSDACFAPVLNLAEVRDHHQMKSRNVYTPIDGWSHPGPAPRFSRSPGEISVGGVEGAAMLERWGVGIPKALLRTVTKGTVTKGASPSA